MATSWYTEGIDRSMRGELDLLGGDIRVMLMKEAHEFSVAHRFVADVVADEAGFTNYERKVLATKSLTKDNGASPPHVTFDAADVTYVDAGNGVNEEVGSVIVFVQVTDDSDSWLISHNDSPNFTTNGEDVTLTISGLLRRRAALS